MVTATLPVKLPAVEGANPTLNDVLCPAANEKGNPSVDTEKPVPLAVIWDMDTAEFPVLVNVTVSVVLESVVRLPKLSEVGFKES